ncbi:MAG: hypothetical protein AAGC71_13600 [Pseudomonadota bacterium]
MALSQEITKLKAIRRQVDAIFDELKRLAEADRRAPQATLARIRRVAQDLDDTARSAARARRAKIIADLTARIRQYDTLLSMPLDSNSRSRFAAERASLVARRGYHRGRQGLDFVGIVSKDQVDQLEALITEVNQAILERKKAIAYIDGVIRIGMAATQIIDLIAAG